MNISILSIILLGWGSLLPKNTYITSSFGTYRPGRFHTGVDLSTHGRTGSPLITPFKSQVWRIFASYYGYGKALYLRIPTGNIVVLAHLSRFSNYLENYLFDLQISNQSYFVNYFPPQPIPINKGEVVVYTGKSGVGPPHLHIEVRTPDNKPVNPLFYLKINDTRPPEILRIKVIPRNRFTIVDSSLWEKSYSTKKANASAKTKWTIPKDIEISGPFGVEIKAVDYINGSPYALIPYKILVYLGKELVYHLEFDTLDFAKSWLSPIVFDYDGSSYSSSWIRLYRVGDMVPPVVKLSKKYLTLSESESDSLLIEVYDFSGNSATLTVPLTSISYNKVKKIFLLDDPDFKEGGYGVRINPYHVVVYLYGESEFLFKDGELVSYNVLEDGIKVISIDEPGMYYTGSEDIPFLFQRLSPAGDTIQYRDWSIVFRKYAVPESTWVFVKEVRVDLPEGLKGSGRGLAIIGGRSPLLKKFKVLHGEGGDLYKVSGTEVTFVKDGGAGWGIYAFVEDTTPPKIRVMSRRKVLAKLKDDESGIDGYTLKVFVDNNWVPAEYDPDDGIVSYDKNLSTQPHQIKIRVQDQAGNGDSLTYTIRP